MPRHRTVEMPPAVAALPRDKHDRPIPWFVHIDDAGNPDFRVVRREALRDAIAFGHCWVCGRTRGRHAAFVIGPMCSVNRVSAEPPSHLDCALFSAQTCPFLTTPNMTRRETGLPDDKVDPAGVMLSRNPGVALVWSSRTWGAFRVPREGGYGVLFQVGDPTETSWWSHGRPATRDEVVASIDSGLPLLRDEAGKERRPTAALAELDQMHARALELVPA